MQPSTTSTTKIEIEKSALPSTSVDTKNKLHNKEKSPKIVKNLMRSQSLATKGRVSSLYAPTKSTMDKQRMRSFGDFSDTFLQGKMMKKSVHIHRGPTIPITPKFKTNERFRMNNKSNILSTEDREMLDIEESRKVEEERIKKAKKVFQWVKVHSTSIAKTVFRSTKELTVPTTPISHLTRRRGQKVCSNETGPMLRDEVKFEESFHNRPPTQQQPFQFATDARIRSNGKIIIYIFTLYCFTLSKNGSRYISLISSIVNQ